MTIRKSTMVLGAVGAFCCVASIALGQGAGYRCTAYTSTQCNYSCTATGGAGGSVCGSVLTNTTAGFKVGNCYPLSGTCAYSGVTCSADEYRSPTDCSGNNQKPKCGTTSNTVSGCP